jgi:hypothetical protein
MQTGQQVAELPHPQREREAYFAALISRFGGNARVSDVAMTVRVIRSALHDSTSAVEGSR